jgi:hypothetical protein
MLRSRKVGNADSYLLEATDLADYGARWMERQFAPPMER